MTWVVTHFFVSRKCNCHGNLIGYDDLPYNERDGLLKADNINNYSSKGIILDQFYVQPSCSPSRAALLSGRHPIYTGFNVRKQSCNKIHDNSCDFIQEGPLVWSRKAGLEKNFKTLAEMLSENRGYSCHALGK